MHGYSLNTHSVSVVIITSAVDVSNHAVPECIGSLKHSFVSTD